MVKEYEVVIRSRKKGTLKIAFRKGRILKHFKESKGFVEIIKKLRVSRSTVYFKINLLKILEKYLKLTKSLLSLNVSIIYSKTVKRNM